MNHDVYTSHCTMRVTGTGFVDGLLWPMQGGHMAMQDRSRAAMQACVDAHVSLPLHPKFACVVLCAQLAKAAGVPVVLDAGGVDAPLPAELCACLAVLSPNETELARLTGMPTEDEQQVKTVRCCLCALLAS